MSEHKRLQALAHGRHSRATPLGAAARYFPAAGGRYRVQVGLSRLGSDYGNGSLEAKAFQLDRGWRRYRREKARVRRADPARYIASLPGHEALIQAAVEAISGRLAQEHPGQFRRAAGARSVRLRCRLSGDTLLFDSAWRLQSGSGCARALQGEPDYFDALDALGCQVQEDLALVQVSPEGTDRLVAVHVCFPSHWSPAAKLGGSFAAVHAPVPGFEGIAAKAGPLLRHLVSGGDFVRFVWGLVPDRHLDHHPQRRGATPWRPGQLPWLRVERQVTLALPAAGGFLFLIRSYLYSPRSLAASQREAIARALGAMSDSALAYKGLYGHRDALIVALRCA